MSAFSQDISQLSDRLEELRSHLGVPKKEFAEMLGVPPSTYSSIIGSRRSKPGLALIFAAIKRGYANPTWLFTGLGEMLRRADEDPEAIAEGLVRPEHLESPSQIAPTGWLADKEKLIIRLEKENARLEAANSHLEAELERARALQKTGTG